MTAVRRRRLLREGRGGGRVSGEEQGWRSAADVRAHFVARRIPPMSAEIVYSTDTLILMGLGDFCWETRRPDSVSKKVDALLEARTRLCPVARGRLDVVGTPTDSRYIVAGRR